jgi:hypothetical protein
MQNFLDAKGDVVSILSRLRLRATEFQFRVCIMAPFGDMIDQASQSVRSTTAFKPSRETFHRVGQMLLQNNYREAASRAYFLKENDGPLHFLSCASIIAVM